MRETKTMADMCLRVTVLNRDSLISLWKSMYLLLKLSERKRTTFYNKFHSTQVEREPAQLLETQRTHKKLRYSARVPQKLY